MTGPALPWHTDNKCHCSDRELPADNKCHCSDRELPADRIDSPLLLALRKFCSEISVVGARYVSTQNVGFVRRFGWGFLILFGVGFALYQIFMQTRYFLTFPVSVKMSITDVPSLEFPTVTICNENGLNKSKLLEIDPTGDLSWATSTNLAPVQLTGLNLNSARAFEILQKYNDEDWRAIYNFAFLDNKEMLIECRFNGVLCDESALKPVDTNAGRCIQFNPNGNVSSSVAGSLNGLQLVLTADVENYNNPQSPSAGFRLLIHRHSEAVVGDVLRQAFKVDVNHHTQVKVQSEEIIRLPEPYGSCSDDENSVRTKCSDVCYQEFIMKSCSCGLLQYYDKNISVCNALEVVSCVLPNNMKFTTEKLETTLCECPQQCHEHVYPYQVSLGKFSKYFVNWFQEAYEERKFSAEYMEENLAIINIYLESLKKTEMITQPAYTLLSLLCDIGGVLGLILGSTVLTFFEILDFLIVEVSHSKKSKVNVRK